ncbi:hypothetical protein A0H81_10240 [Grifola frondosa]|uniref:Uncharacterized protein n=1 Tax=Grifola frondosa TaxID=5627 RepID=A0A1C7LY14_GRIFR|nr:hypothetical protein A0H81_10240 [Grifola frondosa]
MACAMSLKRHAMQHELEADRDPIDGVVHMHTQNLIGICFDLVTLRIAPGLVTAPGDWSVLHAVTSPGTRAEDAVAS